jgi:hypothetical protein
VPISAKGAQELVAPGTPVNTTRVAAKARERTSGAQTMIAVKQRLETSQAVMRSGWRLAARMSSDWVGFGEGSGRSRGKFALTGFGEEGLGRSDNVGTQDGRGEYDDREEYKGEGSKPSDIAEGIVGALSWVGGWRRSRIFVAIVGFANLG